MSVVKRTISLPKELNQYANRKAKEAARPTGMRPNVSGFLADLVAGAKRQDEESEKQKEAA